MTTINTSEGRARQRRILDLQDRGRTEADAAAIVDAELELEAAERAAGSARATEFAESYADLTSCGVPGCRHGRQATTGLCARHSLVLRDIEAERVGGETLPDGSTARDWITALLIEREQRAS